MFKVATWNVNSIRKRIDQLCNWLVNDNIDVALLQEIKCSNEQFPYEVIESLGYKCCVNGQKGRNGVAVITKYPIVPSSVITTIFSDNYFLEKDSQIQQNLFYSENCNSSSYNVGEARYIECIISYNDFNIRVASVYVPNGQDVETGAFEYKLAFFDKLYQHMSDLLNKEEIVIIGGDYNVACDSIDVYSPELLDGRVCFNIKEREKFRSIINLGFIDSFRIVNGNKQKFSWWNYKAGAWQQNKGMRIDYLLLSPQAADKLQDSIINDEIRALESPSDHTPVICALQ